MWSLVLGNIGSASIASDAGAQTTGALFLLVPFGARAVGVADAVVADSALGTEGIWWNAAAMARIPKRELAFHHSQTAFAQSSDMLAYAIPSRVLGTLAASAYLVNYGDQFATSGSSGDVPLGNISNINWMAALSYATPVGKRFSAGVTYKYVAIRFNCTGVACGEFPTIAGSTQALDLGAQFRMPTAIPLTIGASLRNLGPALQVKDKYQADPLPHVLQVGVKARVPVAALKAAGGTLDVSADVLTDLLGSSALGSPVSGVGAVLGYREQFYLRAGYKLNAGGGSGPSLGFSLERGGYALDFAQRYDAASGQFGQTPTYISLRARF